MDMFQLGMTIAYPSSGWKLLQLAVINMMLVVD